MVENQCTVKQYPQKKAAVKTTALISILDGGAEVHHTLLKKILIIICYV